MDAASRKRRQGGHSLSQWRGHRGNEITCAGGEALLLSVTGLFQRPNVLVGRLRADLVGFRADGDVDVAGLKVSSIPTGHGPCVDSEGATASPRAMVSAPASPME